MVFETVPTSNTDSLAPTSVQPVQIFEQDMWTPLLPNMDYNRGDSHRPEDDPSSPLIKDGCRVHQWLNWFAKNVDSVTNVFSVISEGSIVDMHYPAFKADLKYLADALACMSKIYDGIEAAQRNRRLILAAWHSKRILQDLFQLVPMNLCPEFIASPKNQELLRKVTAWVSKEGELQRLRTELAAHIKIISVELSMVKVESCEFTSLASLKTCSAGQLAVLRSSAAVSVTETASTTAQTAPSVTTVTSTITKASSIPYDLHDANEQLILNQLSIAPKSPNSSASSIASVLPRLHSALGSALNIQQDDDTDKNRQHEERTTPTREISEYRGNLYSGYTETHSSCDRKVTCAGGRACDTAWFRHKIDANREEPSSKQSLTDLARGLSEELHMFVPNSRHENTEPGSLENTAFAGLEFDIQGKAVLDRCAPSVEGGSSAIQASSCELSPSSSQKRPRKTHHLGILEHTNSYATRRWLDSHEEPWSPVRVIAKPYSCGANHGFDIPRGEKPQHLHVQYDDLAGNTSNFEVVTPLGFPTASEHDSLEVLFKGLSLRPDGRGKHPSVQLVELGNEAKESSKPPAGGEDSSGPPVDTQGDQKVNGETHKGTTWGGNPGKGKGKGDDPRKPPRKEKGPMPHPVDYDGPYACPYKDKALKKSCTKPWKSIGALKKHLKNVHKKRTEDMKIPNRGTPQQKYIKLCQNLRDREPVPSAYHSISKASDYVEASEKREHEGFREIESEEIEASPTGHNTVIQSSKTTMEKILLPNDSAHRQHRPDKYLEQSGTAPAMSTMYGLGDSLAETIALDVNMSTVDIYFDSEIASQSMPPGSSDASQRTGATSFLGTLTEEECTCLQHTMFWVGNLKAGEDLCWACNGKLPNLC